MFGLDPRAGPVVWAERQVLGHYVDRLLIPSRNVASRCCLMLRGKTLIEQDASDGAETENFAQGFASGPGHTHGTLASDQRN